MSDDKIVKFPTPEKPEFLIGPFEHYDVVVEGRKMPLLTGFREGDKIWIVADNRFCCGPFSEAEAYQAALLAGQCMAVTSGYSNIAAKHNMSFMKYPKHWRTQIRLSL